MSESLTLHFRGKFTLNELRICLEWVTGHQFEKVKNVEWDLFRTTSLGLEISVYDNDFEDNAGIEFTSYPYIVNIDPIGYCMESKYALKYQELTGHVIAQLCSNKLSCECIVVKNLQQLIGTYVNNKKI